MLLTRLPLEPRLLPIPVRLACVRYAASVHPEPGSNSPFDSSLLHSKINVNSFAHFFHSSVVKVPANRAGRLYPVRKRCQIDVSDAPLSEPDGLGSCGYYVSAVRNFLPCRNKIRRVILNDWRRHRDMKGTAIPFRHFDCLASLAPPGLLSYLLATVSLSTERRIL